MVSLFVRRPSTEGGQHFSVKLIVISGRKHRVFLSAAKHVDIFIVAIFVRKSSCVCLPLARVERGLKQSRCVHFTKLNFAALPPEPGLLQEIWMERG